MKNIRAWLVTLLLAALVTRVLWWTVEPLLPYMIGALFMLFILGFIVHRRLD